MLEVIQTDRAISEAEKDFKSGGELLDAREILPELRKKNYV